MHKQLCDYNVSCYCYHSTSNRNRKKIKQNTKDFGSSNTSMVMFVSACVCVCLCVKMCVVAYACVNVPPLGDEPFITTAFIRPGLLVDRWEGRTALELLPHSTSNLTFQRSHFICHPQAPS